MLVLCLRARGQALLPGGHGEVQKRPQTRNAQGLERASAPTPLIVPVKWKEISEGALERCVGGFGSFAP
ncbi:MAG: hypothetical protein D6808_00460 [Candidatus Dadabacteria bacterium]|nr:MAG: hypothetical protein D6808_00460 [Candidatus Dadabacteria bacterium]